MEFNTFRNCFSEDNRLMTLEQFRGLNREELNALIRDANLSRTNASQVRHLHFTAAPIVKECEIKFENAVYQMNFRSNDNLRATIISQLAHKLNLGEEELEFYLVIDSMHAVITSVDILVTGQTYTFAPIFTPAHANEWTSYHVFELLKIRFDDCDLIGEDHKLGPHGQVVLKELEGETLRSLRPKNTKNLSPEDLARFKESNPGLTFALKKSIYAAEKYTEDETTVESFLNLLLFKLGFFEQWLLPIPQYELKLEFLNCTKNAICDLCIVDVISGVPLLIVAKDRTVDNERVNSECQLIAETIGAVMEAINIKRKSSTDEVVLSTTERTIFGLRLNGLVFHFYEVTVSDAMLDAIRFSRAATVFTEIRCQRYLDIRGEMDRKEIVSILDKWRDAMMNV